MRSWASSARAFMRARSGEPRDATHTHGRRRSRFEADKSSSRRATDYGARAAHSPTSRFRTSLSRTSSWLDRRPTLVLNATKDFALVPAALGGYEPYADDLRVGLIADAGHFLHEERPQLIAETALRFFRPTPLGVRHSDRDVRTDRGRPPTAWCCQLGVQDRTGPHNSSHARRCTAMGRTLTALETTRGAARGGR
jgi:hypothetical protein